jgi:hypothetical protein
MGGHFERLNGRGEEEVHRGEGSFQNNLITDQCFKFSNILIGKPRQFKTNSLTKIILPSAFYHCLFCCRVGNFGVLIQ